MQHHYSKTSARIPLQSSQVVFLRALRAGQVTSLIHMWPRRSGAVSECQTNRNAHNIGKSEGRSKTGTIRGATCSGRNVKLQNQGATGVSLRCTRMVQMNHIGFISCRMSGLVGKSWQNISLCNAHTVRSAHTNAQHSRQRLLSCGKCSPPARSYCI